jgi:hypothetical protein
MVSIDRERGIALIEVQGQPTFHNIHEIVEALLRNADHRDGMDEVWDFRHASLANFTIEDLVSIARFLNDHIDRLGKRAALVVGRDVEYGIGQMWAGYAEENAPRERRLFRCMEEAFDWLAPASAKAEPPAAAACPPGNASRAMRPVIIVK